MGIEHPNINHTSIDIKLNNQLHSMVAKEQQKQIHSANGLTTYKVLASSRFPSIGVQNLQAMATNTTLTLSIWLCLARRIRKLNAMILERI